MTSSRYIWPLELKFLLNVTFLFRNQAYKHVPFTKFTPWQIFVRAHWQIRTRWQFTVRSVHTDSSLTDLCKLKFHWQIFVHIAHWQICAHWQFTDRSLYILQWSLGVIFDTRTYTWRDSPTKGIPAGCGTKIVICSKCAAVGIRLQLWCLLVARWNLFFLAWNHVWIANHFG